MPKSITVNALKRENVRYAETRPPVVSLDFTDADTAVAELATAYATTKATVAGTNLSPADKAKADLASALARAILAELDALVDDAVEQLTPRFEAVVEDYRSAVSELLEDLSPEGLLAAGGAAYEAFGRARDAAAEIAPFDAFVESLGALPRWEMSGNEPATRILSPRTTSEYRELLNHAGSPDGSVLAQINPLWRAAAEHGVAFELNTPDDAAALGVQFEYLA